MPDLSVKIDTRRVDELLRTLPDTLARKALVRALNKTAQNVRASASKAIRANRTISASAVRDSIRIYRASRKNLVARLHVTGRPISLKYYGAKMGAKGVTVAVTKGRGNRKLVVKDGIKAFVSDKLGGHVFVRTARNRVPAPTRRAIHGSKRYDTRKIIQLFGPSMPRTFLNQEIRAAWEATAKDAIVKRTQEEVRFELLRIAGKAGVGSRVAQGE